jgi:hypothetical protein
MSATKTRHFVRQSYLLALTLLVIIILTLMGPSEKTLGATLSLVLLHGAWVWTGKVCFGLAVLAGLAALIWKTRSTWLSLTRALAYCGLFFWLTYLPMSLLVMQLSWGGFFFDEPRWRIPFLFGVIAVLLQVGLWLFNNPILTPIGNIAFGVTLWWQLGGLQNVLHPEAPIATSDSTNIQGYFLILLILSIIFGAQLTLWLYKRLNPKRTQA